MLRLPSFLRPRGLIALAAFFLAGLLLLPWWRNHALLRDFYDYGLVMAGAGRINLGERPYVDFATPIQSFQLVVAAWAEKMMGADFLSLTYANAIFIVVSFIVLALILGRRLGGWWSLLITAGVVAASSGQHTIMWHNAIGVAFMAGVVWTTARLPDAPRSRRGSWVFVMLLLWLGGMTKLTYQVAALAFALLFIVTAMWRRQISRREGGLALAASVLFATVFPIATELWYSGASFGQWWHNVVELPGSRTALLKAAASLEFYLRTPHDYYRPLFFPFAGCWGLALLALVGGISAFGLWRQRSGARGVEAILLAVALLGAGACGVTLLATNLDIAYLAGAAWLVLATGIALAFGRCEPPRGVGAGRLLIGIASVSLLVPAWGSAWVGVRSLWGMGPFPRSEFVSADDLPADFNYLRGLRIPSPLHGSLHAFAQYAHGSAARGVPAGSFYFVNGTEWMVRVWPDARHRGLPLWLHQGTTFSQNDVWKITDQLDRGSLMQVVISDTAWDVWFFGMDAFFRERYEKSPLGPQYVVYRLRSDLGDVLGQPLDFAAKLKSNVRSNGLQVSGDRLSFRIRADGGFLGATRSSQLALAFPVPDLGGEFVAEVLPGVGEQTLAAVFRIKERDGDASTGNTLIEERVVVSAKHPSEVRPFRLRTPVRKATLEVELPPGEFIIAGWRGLRVSGSGEASPPMPAPLDPKLPRRITSEAWSRALFAGEQLKLRDLAGFSIAIEAEQREHGPELFTHAPAEVWFRVDGPRVRLTGEFGLRESSWMHPESLLGVTVAVVYSNGARFEVLDRRELRPRVLADRAAQAFEVQTPEAGGWIGLVVTTLGDANAYGHLWWRNVRVHER